MYFAFGGYLLEIVGLEPLLGEGSAFSSLRKCSRVSCTISCGVGSLRLFFVFVFFGWRCFVEKGVCLFSEGFKTALGEV